MPTPESQLRIGMSLNYSGGFAETVVELADYEKAGLDIVFVPEAYSYDAVSQLGYVAAKTERLQLASGIMQLYTRTPTLTAMTAAGLDFVSNGRFNLGIGVSGPQVIEGWHGVPYDAPIGRTRETIEICRAVWRRERLVHDGKHYQIPLPADRGTGLGKALKLINHPVRDRIPIILAAVGPKNTAVAAELAEGWQPIFYFPEKAAGIWGAALAAGKAKRDPSLPELDVIAQATLAIGDDVGGLLDLGRPVMALYVGGMGARGQNFYTKLASDYGYTGEAKAIQDAYLDGRKDEAAALVPRSLLEGISLVGAKSQVAERLAAYKESGVTTLNVQPMAHTHAERVALIEQIKEMAGVTHVPVNAQCAGYCRAMPPTDAGDVRVVIARGRVRRPDRAWQAGQTPGPARDAGGPQLLQHVPAAAVPGRDRGPDLGRRCLPAWTAVAQGWRRTSARARSPAWMSTDRKLRWPTATRSAMTT